MKKKAGINIIVSLITQFVTIICGLIVPRLLLKAFGSEVYGASASIMQFLSYIALLEGGIGGVARAALYKPLAKNDNESISKIVKYLQKFFLYIGLIFIIYVLIVASCFRFISNFNELDYISTFLLVIVISISTMGQYFIGISYAILLQSDQKAYISNIASIITLIINTVIIVILINMNCNIIIVKLFSSLIFIIRPLIMMLYVKRNYNLIKVKIDKSEKMLEDKWTGLGQHIAYFIHSNTDIIVLTTFSSLINVSIYSVYYMVTSHMQNLISSFGTGMEAVFGSLYAKKEINKLKNIFDLYDTLISYVCIILFSTTAIVIVPFITLYTKSITDANYIQPFFGLLMVISSIIFIMRIPYHNLVIASGKFKQTKIAAYGEAILNILISIILVKSVGLIGVAIGTLVAILFRFIYYVFYLSNNIMMRDISVFLKRFIINSITILGTIIIGYYIIKIFDINNYFIWCIVSIIMIGMSTIITSIIYWFFYKQDMKKIIELVKERLCIKK